MNKKLSKIILLLLITILIGVIIGYNKLFGHIITNNFTIKDFSKPITDTLIPKKGKGYSAHIIEIKGIVDDTIIIKICDVCFEQKLIGQVDTISKSLDYYGTEDAIFYFDSYRAKKGKLKIKHSIQ